MTRIRLAPAVVGCAGLLALLGAGFPQSDQPQEQQAAESKKDEPHAKAEEKNKKAETRNAALQLLVTAEGKSELPAESRVTLTGKEGCADLEEQESRLTADGKASFHDLPPCKVTFRILIPGIETKIASVDLAKHKDPHIRIQLKATGPPVVE